MFYHFEKMMPPMKHKWETWTLFKKSL